MNRTGQTRLDAELNHALDLVSELRCAATDFDKITQLEQLQSILDSTHGAIARVSAEFDRSQRERQRSQQVHSRERGRGISDQIALARRITPGQASRDLGFAKTLRDDLPHTARLLSAGRVHASVAQVVHDETTHLDPSGRRAVDAELAEMLPTATPRRAAAAARRAAITIDPDSATRRAARAVQDRRVWMKPLKDGMCRLGAELPAAAALAAHKALRRDATRLIAAGKAGDRTLQQVMADLLVERITGQSQAGATPVEVQLVMTAAQLFGQDPGTGDAPSGVDPDPDAPAWLDGYGPVPAAIARGIAAGAPDLLLPSPEELDKAHAWVRRIFTDPITGALTDVDARRRFFDGAVRRFIQIRDRECRIPQCDSPIREHDHVVRRADDGPTTVENGVGVCQRFNLAKEIPGWSTQVVTDVGPPGRRAHRIKITTPTGKTYWSTAPPVPGAKPVRRRAITYEAHWYVPYPITLAG